MFVSCKENAESTENSMDSVTVEAEAATNEVIEDAGAEIDTATAKVEGAAEAVKEEVK